MKLSRSLLLPLGLAAVLSAHADETWLTNLSAAQAAATKDGKKLLLDFTGSDWCVYCHKLDAEVLATPTFATFAKDYVLVKVDFPRKTPLPADEKKQNMDLAKQFGIHGFPTLIVADAALHEQHRAVGYEPGSGPEAYLAQLAASK